MRGISLKMREDFVALSSNENVANRNRKSEYFIRAWYKTGFKLHTSECFCRLKGTRSRVGGVHETHSSIVNENIRSMTQR